MIQLLVGLSMLVAAIWALSVSSWARTEEGRQELIGEFESLSPETVAGVTFILGVAYLALSVSAMLLARGYAKGRPKARRRGRTVALIGTGLALLAIAVPSSEVGPEHPAWSIVFNLTVFFYLGSSNARSYFRG
ncbi:MAG: hypothetical protein QXZ19_00650 [Thermoplasmata archaeon]